MESLLHRDSMRRLPGKLASEAHLLRVQLNTTTNDKLPFHPDENAATSFKISPEMLVVRKSNVEINFVLVDTLLKLKNMIKVLENHNEIAVDVEGDHRYNYLPILCLIQISCEGHDFVVDCISLYHYIFDYLKDIFLSPKVIKLFWGNADFSCLKRDFNLYMSSVIDVQKVYQKYNKFSNPSKLSNFVKDIIDIDFVGKEKFQKFSWKSRPLPEDAIEYARNDSRFLFDCWQIMKVKCYDFLLKEFNMNVTNELIVKRVTLPTPRNPVNEFYLCLNDNMIELKSFLKESEHLNIFVELYNWADKTAKLRDVPLSKVLTKDNLVSLSVVKPKSVIELHELLPKLKAWKNISLESLLNVISKNYSVQKVVPTTKFLRNINYSSDDDSDDDMIAVVTSNKSFADWDSEPENVMLNENVSNGTTVTQENVAENNSDEIANDDHDMLNDTSTIDIVKESKTKINHYDSIDSFEKVRKISDEEILNNFMNIRRSKMLKSWINYIRNKRRKLRQKLCNEDRKLLELPPVSFRSRKKKSL